MKYFVASDIHGSETYCRSLLRAFDESGAERLLLLGDLLYHGPRNDLPDGYAPKAVIALLSSYKEKILAVRGNCDTEVDQMVLPFPILADYAWLFDGAHTFFLTHGHKYTKEAPPPLPEGTVMLFGHTHVPGIWDMGSFLAANPGSVSIPKENSARGYLLIEDGVLTWKTLDGDTVCTKAL